MLYLYDDAIIEDLKESFNITPDGDNAVSIVSPEELIGIASQIHDDKIHFPIISLERDSNYQIDTQRKNFTRMHKGVATAFDRINNQYYYEKAIPITLNYTLVILSTNTSDIDELLRELLFKYTEMFFLNLKVPYESDRKIRFGVEVIDDSIERYTSTSDYLSEGKLHSVGIKLRIHGAVLLHYTPVTLKREHIEISPKIEE